MKALAVLFVFLFVILIQLALLFGGAYFVTLIANSIQHHYVIRVAQTFGAMVAVWLIVKLVK